MENSETTEAEVLAEISRRQQEVAAESREQVDDIAHRRRMGEICRTMAPLTDEQIRKRDLENERKERERELHARYSRVEAFLLERGQRYGNCTLKNYEAKCDRQTSAVAMLEQYRQELGDRVANGEGLVLYGPKGTGKDHLLVAMAKATILSGYHLLWVNGMDLFGEARDRMDSGESERALVSRHVAPDVLYLSDPVPPLGNLTDFQSSLMFRILDGRYSRRKPTWCSVNVSKGAELETRMGAQNVDRLRDGAMAIHCDWPSYREARA